MIRNILKTCVVAISLGICSIANASLITITFDITNYNDELGTFSGIDSNSDQLLQWSELSSFYWTSQHYGHKVTLADLTLFGDFDLQNNKWLANAKMPQVSTADAYFAWNNNGNAVRTSWASMRIVSTNGNQTSIPEPSSLVILGLGLLALSSRKYLRR
ncbi:PEP-CTERM sorting domain-containing protein [Bowmanella denitrificans]|uniref:PEP-CTERM sorting domain-containing protein n=1 Tax=Bowmanella denitrificans TaxID=366582 RepID=UPI000C9BE72E|nr:PEP-CTERM sorting domain-containing protein [Bowmanella denitrificans]